MSTTMRLRYAVRGGHVHCRLFVGQAPDGFQPAGYTLAKAGDLIFRADEWTDVQVAFECGGVEVLPEAAEVAA